MAEQVKRLTPAEESCLLDEQGWSLEPLKVFDRCQAQWTKRKSLAGLTILIMLRRWDFEKNGELLGWGYDCVLLLPDGNRIELRDVDPQQATASINRWLGAAKAFVDAMSG